MHMQGMMLSFMQQMTGASYAHSLHSYHHPHTILNFVNEEAPTYPPVTERVISILSGAITNSW